MFFGARGVGGPIFSTFWRQRPSKVKNEDKSLKSKVMAFFGQNKLEPIPPPPKKWISGCQRGRGGPF